MSMVTPPGRQGRGCFCLGDCRSFGYRVPKEWGTLTEAQRGVVSLAAFKGESRRGFLAEYGASVCSEVGYVVCLGQG